MTPLAMMANHTIPFFIALLQKLDANCFAPLKAHTNKIVCFAIDEFAPIYLEITPTTLVLIEKAENIDTTFSGPLSAFMRILFSKQRTHTGVHIKGDTECAKALFDCFNQLNIDWEGHLAKGVGDTMAHAMMVTMQETKTWLSETYTARKDDLGVYLQDEVALLPTKGEAQAFYHEVDSLRHDVERLAAKMAILQQQLAQK
ncbi:MAG: hypothetical protein JSR17_08665 [Proteobacteria bacterium]|nr:hypothetical protein [Pseudomonadota bacterium]